MSKYLRIDGGDAKIVRLITTCLQKNGYTFKTVNAAATGGHCDLTLLCRRLDTTSEPSLTIGSLTIDLNNLSVTNGSGEQLRFTPTEMALLIYLVKNKHRAVPRTDLLPVVWGYENNTNTRVADDTVKRIRKKLVGTGVSVETVWGYGFKIVAQDNA